MVHFEQATSCLVAFLLRGQMRAIIFANGNPPQVEIVRQQLSPTDWIIAADGGTRHALSLGITPHVVIGDLDSLAEADRAQLERSQVPLIGYPARKDHTDLELALRHALERGATEIVIFTALGGRWDQSLANLMLLALPGLNTVPAQIIEGKTSARVIRARAEITGRVGDTLSLIALKGDARGVTIAGCEYPLERATLPFGATLGISNVLVQPRAIITVEDGLILALLIACETRED